MNDLIRIVNTKISDAEIKTVNARELHVFLDSGQEFANWIKSRIADFGFIDGQDFLTICHQKTDGVFFSLEQIKLLQNMGVWDFLGVNSDYLFFFEKFNGEAEHETF